MRPRLLVLLLLGVSVLLVGCAGADRVVTGRETTVASNGKPVYRLEWTSGAYGPRVFDYPRPDRDFERDCFRQVVVGEAVPFACMTLVVLRDETDAFGRNLWLAVGLSVVVTAVLVLFSLRRISWARKSVV